MRQPHASVHTGGVAVAANTTDGRGINLHFREGNSPGAPTFNHFRLLNDGLAWDGNTSSDIWAVGQWKWLRLVYNGTTVQARIWDAGTTPEPTGGWDLTWTPSGRTGLAGLVTNSIGGLGEFEVDYVLIQAPGLPLIRAIPEPATAAFLFLGSALVLRRRR